MVQLGGQRADTVREPAVKERPIGRAALGETKASLALQRLERTQTDGLAAAPPARLEKGFKRGQRARSDTPVGNQLGKFLSVAVKRGQRALDEVSGGGVPC